MNLRVELIPCPGCGQTTHYQWVTHGTRSSFCPECKGTRIGLPASDPILVGLIYRIAPSAYFAQTNWLSLDPPAGRKQ